MYILYNSIIRNNDNYGLVEGAGSNYQRIITLIAICKAFNLDFLHYKINIGHNSTNMDFNLYDELWDKFFNIKKFVKLKSSIKIDDFKEIKVDAILPQHLEAIIYYNQFHPNDNNFLLYIKNPYFIINSNPNDFYELIQNDIINAYNSANSDRKLIYNNKITNIAIHIRVYNDFDNLDGSHNNYLDGYIKTNNCRFIYTEDFYINLINKLNIKYPNNQIYIFSEKKYFDLKYKKLRNFTNLNFQLDMNNFDTFHHLVNSDVLVLGTSSFSHLAGLYNNNQVIYLNYEYFPKSLNKWLELKDL